MPTSSINTPNTQTKHNPAVRVPKHLHHQLLHPNGKLPGQNPNLTPNSHHTPPTLQGRVLPRELPLGVFALLPLVLPVLTRHADVPPDQPEIGPVTPRADRHPTQPVVARIRLPRVPSPHQARPAPEQPLRRTPVGIGLSPHPNARRNPDGGRQPITPEHHLPRHQIGIEVLNPRNPGGPLSPGGQTRSNTHSNYPGNFDDCDYAALTVTTAQETGKCWENLSSRFCNGVNSSVTASVDRFSSTKSTLYIFM
jgi:hypothetical protein